MAGFDHLFVILSVILIPGSCEVSLNSSLVDGKAFFGDTVNFTCRTVGSDSLAWSSPEYIGQNGRQLSLSPAVLTGSVNGYVVAVVTNAYLLENGQRVLESNLTIIVQGNIPNASVTCTSLGTGEMKMTTFSLAKNLTVQCQNLAVCPGYIRNFTCETRNSTSLSWESAHYIGDIPLSFTPVSPIQQKSRINPNVSASLMMNYETNGVRVLMSQLIVMVSDNILDDMNHTITCVNVGHDISDSCTLQMDDDMCSSPGLTESETTQSGKDSDSVNLYASSAFPYIISSAAIVVFTAAALGVIT